MNRSICLLAFVMFGAATNAHADTQTAFCETSSLGTDGRVSCDGKVTWNVDVDGKSIHLGIEVEAPPEHCSSVFYAVRTLAGETLATSAALAGGESEILDLGTGYPAGVQSFNIMAEGQVGGCNQGVMSGWGVITRGVLLP